MPSSPPWRHRRLLLPAAVTAAYFLTGWLGLRWAQVGHTVTLIWAPTGLALAAVLLGGRRLSPAIWLGAFLVNLAVGSPPALAAWIATGNTLEAVGGAWLLQRSGFAPDFERGRDLLTFLLGGVLAAPVVSASLGVGGLLLLGDLPAAQAGSAWWIWWLGDAGGALIVAPAILTWQPARGSVPIERRLEAAGWALGLVASCLLAWTPLLGAVHPALAIVPFPFVLGAALRLGLRGAAGASLLAAALAVGVTAAGTGPFVAGSTADSLILLWTFMSIVAMAALVLGGLAQAERAESRQRTHRLEVAKLAAEETARAKTEFLANVSHELRTPMNGIVGVAELLRDMALPPSARAWIEVIDQSADHLRRMIDDLLDLSQIDSGHLSLAEADVDLDQLLSAILSLLRPRAERKGIRLSTRCDEEVPPRIVADPTRLSQVLMNLVGNAVKFTDRGGVTVEIARLPEPPARLRFTVRDTGIGIQEEDRGKLFEPFSQVDPSAHRQQEGAGLGLAISRRLVQAMGGEIGFADSAGSADGGATFFFTLPERVAAAPSPAPAAPPAGALQPGLPLLVVDDNVINRRVAALLLRSLGLEVVEVESGPAALAALAETPFAAVLLDCQMPGMDGFETVRHIRQRQGRGPRLPVIALTAHAGPEQRARCLAAGMDDHIAKPCRRDELTAVLRRWLPAAVPPPDR
jgi:signal transduction histidine kinase/CheY-like chemotaxis protein